MTPEQRRMLADLLIQWEDSYLQGQDTPAEVVCKDYPELAEILARQIATLKRVAWLDKKLDDDEDENPSGGPPDASRSARLLAGRYRLDQLIATGGFAEVWRAFDRDLLRIVAVKIPKRTVTGAADSFLAEARRVARLKHPMVLPVYDVGLDGDDCFFVSEYVEGGSLADRLLRGRTSTAQACRWIASIADALEHAHTNGVIHRDIKPGNILIDAHDRALLADFGIAQSSMQSGAFASSLGTLRYMPPEQLDGQAPVPQSDIYSLAVVLHEALTGRPPYSSSEPNTLRREIGSGAKVSKDVPARLVHVLRRALSQDPGHRFASAGQFAAAVRKASRPSSWALPCAAAAVAGALLLFWALQRKPTPAFATAPAEDAAPTTRTPPRRLLRSEAPYPLPPFNRRKWVSSSPTGALGYDFDADTGWWSEIGSDGHKVFSFRQAALTDEHVSLADASRGVWLRLSGTACEISTTPDYKDAGVMLTGSWAHSTGSPLPPAFDKLISWSGRDTLANHVHALGKIVGVRVGINTPALQAEGITKNQSVELHTRDQPAHEVLRTMLFAADPEDRLRAVLAATDDGQVGIDVTTVKALGTP